MSVVPTHVLIPHYTDLHPSRTVYETSWFILSVLFLKDGETSVVPRCFQIPLSHGPPSQQEHQPNQPVHSFCVVFDRW